VEPKRYGKRARCLAAHWIQYRLQKSIQKQMNKQEQMFQHIAIFNAHSATNSHPFVGKLAIRGNKSIAFTKYYFFLQK